MTAAPGPAEHHASAALHHEQAAQFHIEASRLYQIGTDYSQAAHNALSAHGHALRAMEHGQAARACYAEYERNPLPNFLNRTSAESVTQALTSPIELSGSACHAVAADHHHAAVRHHGQAGVHCDAEHYVRAHHETENALNHGKHALFHADQAALRHTEHYGNRASAELV
jgi:hypothetical protein